MRIGTVHQVWRYPVKGMGGERLPAASLSRRGIPGDRGWALYDEERGGITNAKRLHVVREVRARYLHEPVAGEASPPAELQLPDGAVLRSDSPEAAQQLSALTGRSISMRSLGPAGTETDPRLTTAAEPPEVQRALGGLLPGEPEPDFSMFTPERLLQLRQGNFFDAFPLHLLSRESLHTLKRLAPESDWDTRRFRANFLIDADGSEGYPELAWVGRRVRIGAATIQIVMGCPRCVMVTLQEHDLPQDHRIMRTLVRETKHIAGVYANVVEEGVVREGDAIELLGDPA